MTRNPASPVRAQPDSTLPNLRHLHALACVGHLRSVNRAAQDVNLSQPAVTQAVLRLERQFGAQLFVRHPTGMYATDAGNVVLRRVDRLFEALAESLAEAGVTPHPTQPDRLIKSVQLQALATLSRAPDYETTARRLGITTAALSRSLHALEGRLGLSLLLRDGSQIRLSQAGRTLARGARLALRELEAARDELALTGGRMRGRLLIGALPLTRSYLVPKALVAISTRHPAVRVQLVEGPYNNLLHALREWDIDILVGTLRLPPPADDVVEHVLAEDRLCVVGRAGHPLATHPAPGRDEFQKFPWIAPRSGSPARQAFDEIFGGLGNGPRQVLEVASHMAVRSILRESDSLALISRRQIHYEEIDGQLIVLSETLVSGPRTIGYTVRSRWQPTPIQTDFIEELRRISVGTDPESLTLRAVTARAPVV